MRKLSIILTIPALVVGVFGVVLAILPQEVEALTDKEIQSCHTNYAGHGGGAAVPKDKRDVNLEGFKKNSKCYKGNGGTCDVKSYEDGFALHCTNPKTGTVDNGKPAVNHPNAFDKPDQAKCDGDNGSKCCNGVKTSFQFGCKSSGDKTENNPVVAVFLAIVNFLAIGVGVAVVGGIIYGAIRYITANGNSGKTQEAISIMVNAGVALVIFALMYAIINFIVPGGLFN